MGKYILYMQDSVLNYTLNQKIVLMYLCCVLCMLVISLISFNHLKNCSSQVWTLCSGKWPVLLQPNRMWRSDRTESSSTSRPPPPYAPPKSTSVSEKSSTRRRWMAGNARWVTPMADITGVCRFRNETLTCWASQGPVKPLKPPTGPGTHKQPSFENSRTDFQMDTAQQ